MVRICLKKNFYWPFKLPETIAFLEYLSICSGKTAAVCTLNIAKKLKFKNLLLNFGNLQYMFSHRRIDAIVLNQLDNCI